MNLLKLKYNHSLYINYFLIISLILCVNIYELKSTEELITLYPLIIRNYQGNIGLNGIYRRIQYPPNLPSSAFLFSSNIRLSIASILFAPEVLTFDLNGEYSSTLDPLEYVSIPEASENFNTNRIGFQSSVLNLIPLNLNIIGNLGNSFSNRGFGQNIKTQYNDINISSNIDNTILPISASYSKNFINETELLNNVNYRSVSDNYTLNADRDLFGFINNKFSTSFQKLNTQYYDSIKYQNRILDILMSNSIGSIEDFLQINSNAQYFKSFGSFNNTRFNEIASINLNFPYRFKLVSSYNLNSNLFDSVLIDQRNARIQLNHQLYGSVFTNGYFELINTNQKTNINLDFREQIKNYLVGIIYTKKIQGGRITVGYDFRTQNLTRDNQNLNISVNNEEHLIEDGKQIMLNYPDIIENSIIVKDSTNTLVFQKNIDYLLIESGGYIQILRIPTGRIKDNSKVFIDYIKVVEGTQNSKLINHTINSNLSILNGLISLYFRFYENKNYVNNDINLTGLRNENVKTAGINFNIGEFYGTTNYIIFNSNISPYNAFDINAGYFNNFNNEISTNISGNARFLKYTQTNQNNLNANLNLVVRFYLLSSMFGIFETKYSYAKVLNVQMSNINFKAEIKMKFYESMFSLGAIYTNQKLESSQNNYYNIFFRLERAFGYF